MSIHLGPDPRSITCEPSRHRDEQVPEGVTDPSKVRQVLAQVVSHLPGGGEPREGQAEMAEAVARAIAEKRHLAVQAGTGTGKTLAYLVPAILMSRSVVVATATRAERTMTGWRGVQLLAQS